MSPTTSTTNSVRILTRSSTTNYVSSVVQGTTTQAKMSGRLYVYRTLLSGKGTSGDLGRMGEIDSVETKTTQERYGSCEAR